MKAVGVIGASGFTGTELLRLCAAHPDLDVAYTTGHSQSGTRARDVYPNLAASYPDLVYEPFDLERTNGLDVVFLGLPHEASMELAPTLLDTVPVVVDLSAAFRLRDPALYRTYYGFDHSRPELLEMAVYGLPELHRGALERARLVATPGCYVTAATLALQPMVDTGLVEPTGIIVDAASGVSGAGRQERYDFSFNSIDENFSAYGLLNHRHTPEMEQQIGAQILFTPHLAPMNRGILATCYARPATDPPDTDGLLEFLHRRWADEPFVTVVEHPHTKACLGSNMVQVTARYDARTNTVVAIAALDNLAKGASGGALQAANVALGLDETAGLSAIGIAP